MVLSQILKFWRPSFSKNYVKFPVKFRDIQEIEKKNSIDIIVFGYKNKDNHLIYVSKRCFKKKHVDLLLLGEERKRHYVFIKDFKTFMYDYTLHCVKKHFSQYCLEAFSTEKILKRHIKTALKLMTNKKLQYLKKATMLNLKIMGEE